ncbi:hypothetical protein J5N97_024164 [Dioscorea zingiberensis]|uniref:CDT1 Geminin-binding domain-containing protein n=1 Tax=Dioscorea zingiberensis TaxID=325984 RepID=A0A9D5H8P3_9LILI|nr:hypothetical protein J5N97_024164 [Dioscorea zingiberensis]
MRATFSQPQDSDLLPVLINMEYDSSEHSTQTSIKFRCKKMLSGEAKKNTSSPTTTRTMGIDEKGNSENTLAAQTPEKPECRIKGSADNSTKGPVISEYSERYICVQGRSPKHEAIEIPEKYKILADLFDGMVCSIRLLGLCKRATTFQNISTQVEILTKRKFFSNHLAQMKYLFPEAIQMETVLVHDVSSLCMKQDLKITLLHIMECPVDPVKSVYASLSEAFHSKLEDFLNAQSEVADIPEDILPVPFNQRNDTMLINRLTERSATIRPLGLPQFSDKVVIPEALKTQLLTIPDSLVSVEPDDEIVAFDRSPWKKDDITSASTINCTYMISPPNYLTGSKFSEGTPTKSSINSDELRTETPALQTPKRALPTPNGKLVIEEGRLVTEAKVANSVRRSLIYSPEKPDGVASRGVKSSCELTTSKSCLSEDEFGGSPATQMLTVK